jgi:hypothetical protein
MKEGFANPDPFGRSTDRVKMNPGYQNPGLLEPAGPIDPDVSVLSVRTAEGKPLALLGNYSLHYVGSLPPLSADYFGIFADRIGSLIGADERFVGILSNGTSGDVNNIDYSKPAPIRDKTGDRCRVVAEVVAKAAKKAYDTIQHRRDLSLAAVEEELEFKVRKPTNSDLNRARSILAKAQGRALKGVEEIYARELVLLADYPDTVMLKLQALRIGSLGIAAIPCEVFTEIGLAIKKGSPHKQTFSIELANGYNGYLPTPAQHKLGGYETWRARSSYLEEEASDKITTSILRLLDNVTHR